MNHEVLEPVRATLAEWLESTSDQQRRDLHTALKAGCSVNLEITLNPPPFHAPPVLRVTLTEPEGRRHVLSELKPETDFH